jgi:hypothetical protein
LTSASREQSETTKGDKGRTRRRRKEKNVKRRGEGERESTKEDLIESGEEGRLSGEYPV